MSNKNWDSLSEQERKDFFANFNLGYGIIFPPNVPFGFGRERITEIDPTTTKIINPAETAKWYTQIIDSKFEFKLKQIGKISNEVNFGLNGTIKGVELGGDTSSSSQQKSEKDKEILRSKKYLYAEYSVFQKTFTIDSKLFSENLNPDFLGKLKTLVKFSDNPDDQIKLDAMFSLIDCLNQNGWYLPNSFTVGGKITYWDINEISQDTDVSKLEQSFSLSASGSIGLPSVVESNIGTKNNTETTNESSISTYKSTSNAERRVIGGLPIGADPTKTRAWLKSLEDCSTWKIINIDLIPVLSIVPEDLYNHIRKLSSKFTSYQLVKQRADMNVFNYFHEVELTRPKSLVTSEW